MWTTFVKGKVIHRFKRKKHILFHFVHNYQMRAVICERITNRKMKGESW